MATFLDIGLISHFKIVFTILLVFTIVFALLEKSKMLGANKGLHSLIALCVAMMMLFVPGVTDVISVMAPWFILMFLLVFFFMLMLLAFGTKMESITQYASHWDVAHWFFLVIGIVVFIGSIAHVYGSTLLPYSDAEAEQVNVQDSTLGNDTTTDTGDFNQNVGRVIFHPKTIGAVLILIIGSLTIKLMTGISKK